MRRVKLSIATHGAGVLSRVLIVSDQSPDMTEIAGAESPVHVYQEIDSIDQGVSKGWSR